MIGATTLNEYRQIEKDAALERRFQPVIVLEPSPEETLEILQGVRQRYEDHHGVTIPQTILELAVRYGERWNDETALERATAESSRSRPASDG
jgi:ATP-dependent Clp protease ATP-binding subunit ClpC